MMKEIIDIPEEDYKNLLTDEKIITINSNLQEVIKNGTPLPNNATNGDIVKTIYPQEPIVFVRDGKYIKISGEHFSTIFDVEWWNAPYKENA